MKKVEQQVNQNRANFNSKNAQKAALASKHTAVQQKLVAAKTWVGSLKKSIF